MREWVFRDDEVSTDTRSSTTELHESSQEEEGDVGRSLLPQSAKAHFVPKGLDIGRAAPNSDKGTLWSGLSNDTMMLVQKAMRSEIHALALSQDHGARALGPPGEHSELGCAELRLLFV